MSQSYWLMKSEPETYSFSQLLKDKKTNWNGVRNFQARNHLKNVQVGDLVLFYHSGDDKAVVGIAKVIKAGYPDPDPKKPGDWVQVDVEPVRALKQPVTLAQIKQNKQFKDIPLIKQSRLSVMPVTAQHYKDILALGDQK